MTGDIARDPSHGLTHMHRIRRTMRLTTIAALVAAPLGGCHDFLTGDALTTNPNNPTAASAIQLFVAAQVSLFNQQEGQLARLATMYTQQLSGTNNQQRDYGSSYLLTEGDVAPFWNQTYTGGGLVDLRRVQAAAKEAGDARTQGMAMVLEALRIGTATSLWGDIPYSQAVADEVHPTLDAQQQIYATLQVKLDSAIALLAGAGPGPGGADLIFNGNVGRWTRVAYTLQARYHMHTAERLDQTAYQAALAAAQKGINEAPTSAAQAINGQAPGDLLAVHGNTVNDGNIWSQFLANRADMTANQQFIALLQRRSDPRLAAYFDPAGNGQYQGANQFGVVPSSGASVVDVATRRQFVFQQPIVTWTETQLIMAEALFRLGQADASLQRVNAVRQAAGLPALAGPVTLDQIAEEKYVGLFQNIEAYSDWRRLCYPRLTPGGQGGTPAASGIPARLPYPVGERNANPNIPAPGAAPQRNWDDPNPCP
jgi:Starch-binding associating with outer membrane